MRSERGSATVEVVLLVPLLVLLLTFVLSCGRWVQAQITVRNAANHAARAASLVSTHRMEQVGLANAAMHLSPTTSSCLKPTAAISLVRTGSISFVTATTRCRVDFTGALGIFGLPRVVSATSTEVIDVFTFR